MPKSPAQALGLAWNSFPVKARTPHSTPKSKSIAEKPAKSLKSHTLRTWLLPVLCIRPPADPQALGTGEADQATLDCQGNPLTTGHQGWDLSLPPNTHPDPPATLHHASVPSEFCSARLAMTHIPKVGLVHRSASVHQR